MKSKRACTMRLNCTGLIGIALFGILPVAGCVEVPGGDAEMRVASSSSALEQRVYRGGPSGFDAEGQALLIEHSKPGQLWRLGDVVTGLMS